MQASAKKIDKARDWTVLYGSEAEKYDIYAREYFDPSDLELKTLRTLADFRNKVVLDVGAGTGRLAIPLAREVQKLCAMDPARDMLDFMRKRLVELQLEDKVEIKEVSSEFIPYPSNYFDIILCVWVVCHFKNFEKSFQEVKRVLKNGGTLLVVDHYGEDEWEMLRVLDSPEKASQYKEKYNTVLDQIKDFKDVKEKVLDAYIRFPGLTTAEGVIADIRGCKATNHVKTNRMLKILNKTYFISAVK